MQNIDLIKSKLTKLADTIRKASASVAKIPFNALADSIRKIEGAGTDDELYSGTKVDLETNAPKVRDYCFYFNKNINNVTFHRATDIGNNAFFHADYLDIVRAPECLTTQTGSFGYSGTKTAYFDKITNVGTNSFENNKNLTTVYMPKVQVIGDNAFEYCQNFVDYDFPEATTISTNAFYKRPAQVITKANFPKVTSVTGYAFYGNIFPDNYHFDVLQNLNGFGYSGIKIIADENFPAATTIGHEAFANSTHLTNVDLSNITSIDSNAFMKIGKPLVVHFPKVTTVGNYLFNGSTLQEFIFDSLQTIKGFGNAKITNQAVTDENFPAATKIGNEAFINTKINRCHLSKVLEIDNDAFKNALTGEDFSFPELMHSNGGFKYSGITNITPDKMPKLATVGEYTFSNCKSLTSCSLDKLTKISGRCFENSTALASVTFPEVTEIGYGSFGGCSGLTKISQTDMPKCKTLTSVSFTRCSSLKEVDLPALEHIGPGCFQNCTKLDTLILRNPNGCNLANTNALSGTVIANGGGSIYVPDELVNIYKSLTNWVVYEDKIKPLSSYPGGV